MYSHWLSWGRTYAAIALSLLIELAAQSTFASTSISIDGKKFLINGRPTYEGRSYEGKPVEGLLFNSRMVQAIFDDSNPETRNLWKYPDVGMWDPQRNTDEFIENLGEYKRNGLLAFTVNLQGGGPKRGQFTRVQEWENTAFNPDGSLREPYLERLSKVLERADELGMVAIVGYFYFGQDQRLEDEDAVLRAVDNATNFLLRTGHKNVLVEIANECDINYDHDIIKPQRVHELINRVKKLSEGKLLVSTSFSGGAIPPESVISSADFILVHGNGQTPERIRGMVKLIRSMPAFISNPKPIVFNEDGTNLDNMLAAFDEYASWGYYDQGENNYRDGFQSPPVNWSINTEKKRVFFELVRKITGGEN
ncbi:MAG: hypothetical protein ACUVXI_15000 [bacterium]